jgi:hypothetical protein
MAKDTSNTGSSSSTEKDAPGSSSGTTDTDRPAFGSAAIGSDRPTRPEGSAMELIQAVVDFLHHLFPGHPHLPGRPSYAEPAAPEAQTPPPGPAQGVVSNQSPDTTAVTNNGTI